MPNEQVESPNGRKPLRLWPGVTLLVVSLLVRFGIPLVVPDLGVFAVLGALLGAVLILLWWLFFSRAPWVERLGALALVVVGLLVTRPFLDASVATAGMGYLFPIYALPFVAFTLVIWAVVSQDWPDGKRRWSMAVAVLAACAAWTLLRSGGIDNAGGSDFALRWSPTPEERMLAEAEGEQMAQVAPLTAESAAEWPGFRGPDRDSVIAGVEIDTDWGSSPPVEEWRRPVGPAWSSFAVQGDLFYTQEQRGGEETVSCYRLRTGEPVWRHGDTTRFWESNAGAGPRGTPTLSGGHVFSFGGTGTLNVLDAADGALVWSRDVAAYTGVEIPMWGFSSSPLVVGDVVVVAAAGKLVAYDRGSGETLWQGPDGGSGYSSPHLVALDGVEQIVLTSIGGAISVAPSDGTVLWNHEWPGSTRIVQPALTADGDLLLSRGETSGLRRVRVARAASGWTTEEDWTTNRLKPYFSDFVVHEGHAYGFDGNILAAVDVETGDRKWKGGRYGSGQLVLLADQDILLVISEGGDLALVSATPDGFSELARFPALDSKTWNHPVVVGDLLLVRNAEEMVAFRLALAGA